MAADIVPLESIVSVKGGKRLPAGTSLQVHPSSHPYIRVRDMGSRLLPSDGLEYVPDSVFPSIQRYIVNENDVIISIVGTIGLVSLIDARFEKASLTENAAKLTGLDKADATYLYYYLRSRTGQEEIGKGTVGAVQAKLPLYSIQKLPVPWFERPVREAIAAVLGALDDKIELNRRMNATLEAMARALFQSWFVDFDPVRAKAEGRPPAGLDAPTAALFPAQLQDSEFGEIPRGWRVGTLAEVAANPRRGVDADDINEATAYIGLEHMPRRCIALSEWDNAEELESNKSEFKRGEILFGKLRPYFHKVGVAPIDGVCSTDILVISPAEPDWFGFVLSHASSAELVNHTDAMSTGTKMPRTKWQDIADFKVVLPPRQIAAAFTQLVEPLVQQIIANIHQSRTLATLRDTLLPKLLSGELSVTGLPLEKAA